LKTSLVARNVLDDALCGLPVKTTPIDKGVHHIVGCVAETEGEGGDAFRVACVECEGPAISPRPRIATCS
jgi:hypothetical protein